MQEKHMELKIEELRTGELYMFIGATDITPIFSGPSPLSRIIDNINGHSHVIFIEATPWSSRQNHCMMVKVIYGELIGYLACYYGPEQPFQAHKFFRKDNH